MPSKFKDGSGHVVTTDVSIIKCLELRKLMQAGTTFRDDYVLLTYETEEEALQQCLKAYVKKSCEINEVPPYLFDEWMSELKQAIKDKCRQI